MAVTKRLAEGLLSLLILTLVVSSVSAQPWLQLDDPPAEDMGDAELTMLVYGRYNVKEPYYSIWNGSEWSEEFESGTMDKEIRWVVTRTAPNRFEVIVGVLTSKGNLYVNVWNGSWGNVETITTDIGSRRSGYRGFDIAYEQNSGDALIVYHRGVGGVIYYRVWNGTSWSDEQSYSLSTLSGVPLWISMASKPSGDEIAILIADSKRDAAGVIWNGNSMGNEQLLERALSTKYYECHGVAYEQSSGYAMFVWGHQRYIESRRWDGSSWEPELPPIDIGSTVYWISIASDPNSNRLAVAVIDSSRDLNTIRWDGTSWTKDPEHDNNLETAASRCADIIFENKTGHEGHIILVWGHRNKDIARFRHFDGTSWSSIEYIEGQKHSTDPRVVQLRRADNEIIILSILDDGKDLNTWTWIPGSTKWIWRKEHWNNLPYNKYEPFMVTRSPGSIPADKVDLYFYNDGVRGYFNETLACAPDPYSFTYVVYLDKPVGGDYPVDFRMVYSTGIWRLMTEDDEVDPADDVSNNHVDIKEAYATSTRNLLIFKTIEFSTIQDGASYYYRVFIDSDQNKSTGYRNYIDGNLLAIGADYLVEYNKKYAGLYQFAGSTQSEWKWSLIGDTDDGRVAYEKEGETLILEIYRDDIGDPEVFDLVYNAEKLGVNADWAPDSYNDTSYHSTYYVKDAWGELQKWDGSRWVYVEDITITEGTNPYSIVFNFSLQGIANPDIMQDTNAWFVEYYGYNQYEFEVDRAPNTGAYFIPSYVIPELPWPTPLIFIPAVTLTVYYLYKRRFRKNG